MQGRLESAIIISFGLTVSFMLGPVLTGTISSIPLGLFVLGAAALAVVFQPLWGVYLILLLSPLKTLEFGSGLLSLTRFLGIWVSLATLIHFTIRGKRLRRTGIEGSIFLMALGMSLSFFRTDETQLVALSILSMLSLYALVFLVVNLVENDTQLKKLVFVFLASAVYPTGLAINQWLQSPYRSEFVVRVSGTFTKSTGLGAFLIPIVLMAFSMLFYAGFSHIVRWLMVGTFAGGLVALVLSFSRSPWMGVLIGLAVSFFTPLFGRRPRREQLAVVVPTAFLIGVIWNFWSLIEQRLVIPLSDLLATGTSTDSILVRPYELAAGLRIIWENYFLGTGIGNYGQAVQPLRYVYGSPLIPSVPHNIVLYFFGEVGIVGAAGFVWLLVWLYRWISCHHSSMATTEPTLASHVYFGSIITLIGYGSYMFFHGGFFTNEIWLTMAFLLVTTRVAQEKAPVEVGTRLQTRDMNPPQRHHIALIASTRPNRD